MATRVKITKLMYGWSKWGGGYNGLVKETLDEWYCQNCGDKQTKDMPTYMIEMDPREYVRVCAKCKHEMIVRKLKDWYDLKGKD